ncbi:putative uncharacterized protein [Desulfovibrio ferrophilus]|uniref:Uncharacterized protein n=2 Tax=Desulfovibrio ferrophilus TaxID=241368 RepID=A0A2Z6B230_9BACT|nr:putative uncharacterized protein [Desulfovibrio ferrophilus]
MLKVEGMSNQGKIVGQLIDIDDKSPSKGTMIPVVGWFYDPYIAFSTKIDVDFRGEFGVAAWVGAIDGGVMIVRWTRIYKDGMLNKVEKKNGKFQLTQPKMYELLLRDRRIKLKKIFN